MAEIWRQKKETTRSSRSTPTTTPSETENCPEVADKLEPINANGVARGSSLPVANDRVRVRKSRHGSGKGVFASQDFVPGDVVCFFHGRRVAAGRFDLLTQPIRDRYSAYMMAGPEEGLLCVPLHADGSAPVGLPGAFSGCFINEAAFVDGVHRKPNVVVLLPPNAAHGSKEGCPVFGENSIIYDWPCVATRRIYKNDEILLCYGEDYGNRRYEVSRFCRAC